MNKQHCGMKYFVQRIRPHAQGGPERLVNHNSIIAAIAQAKTTDGFIGVYGEDDDGEIHWLLDIPELANVAILETVNRLK